MEKTEKKEKKKKGKIRKALEIISAILFIAGLAVILYPHIMQRIYKMQAEQEIDNYTERIEEFKKSISDGNLPNLGDEEDVVIDDDLEWLYELIVKYNKKLFEERQSNLVDPFSYQQVDFSLKQFGFDEEMIGHLEIPQMGIKIPVYLGATKENMSLGGAHLTQTSIPVGGNNTNAVIAAHRGMSTAAMFRDIEVLKVGDEITFTNFRETLTYRVAELAVITPTDIEKVLIQPGRDLITLITCHPYRHNYQRYVVYCERK